METVTGAVITAVCIVGSIALPEITEQSAGADLEPWMNFIYKMTLAIVPLISLKLMYGNRKKKKRIEELKAQNKDLTDLLKAK